MQLVLIMTLFVTQSMWLPPHGLSQGTAHNFEYSVDPGGTCFPSESPPPWSRNSKEFPKTLPRLPANCAIVPDDP